MLKAAKTASERTSPAKKQDLLTEGIRLIFQRWTALQLAVENGWGGSSSAMRAEELVQEVLRMFQTQQRVYPDELDVHLDDFLREELNTIADDGSPREIAEIVVRLAADIANGDMSSLQRLRASAGIHNATQRSVAAGPVGDEDDDVEGDSDGDLEDHAMADDGPVSHGAAAAPATHQPPAVDPEGWQVVGRSKRR